MTSEFLKGSVVRWSWAAASVYGKNSAEVTSVDV